jgi:hypothetical protein
VTSIFPCLFPRRQEREWRGGTLVSPFPLAGSPLKKWYSGTLVTDLKSQGALPTISGRLVTRRSCG